MCARVCTLTDMGCAPSVSDASNNDSQAALFYTNTPAKHRGDVPIGLVTDREGVGVYLTAEAKWGDIPTGYYSTPRGKGKGRGKSSITKKALKVMGKVRLSTPSVQLAGSSLYNGQLPR